MCSCDHKVESFLKVPTEGQISVNDGLHGNTVFECNTLDDQVTSCDALCVFMVTCRYY